MNNHFDVIKNNPLFEGIAFNDFQHLMTCMCAKIVTYKKGEIILLSGEKVRFIGLVLTGKLQIIKEDQKGESTILAELSPAELFGEVFVYGGIEYSPVTVTAVDSCEVLFIDYKKMLATCSSACSFHTKLIENMLQLIAKKNLKLNQKLDILSQRGMRGKILRFFDMERKGKTIFNIPFSREEMAHYLCVDRSALSGELCKMRDEGIIRFNRNQFELIE